MKKSILVASLALPALVFAADRLNVKTGLWEITTLTATQGMPQIPPEALAQLPPEQRSQMEALLKSHAASAQPQVSKECITEKDLEQPFKHESGESCVATVVKSTTTSQELELSCTGAHVAAGKMRINTPTPESMTGDIEVQAANDGEPITIKAQVKGRWLSASCRGATD